VEMAGFSCAEEGFGIAYIGMGHIRCSLHTWAVRVEMTDGNISQPDNYTCTIRLVSCDKYPNISIHDMMLQLDFTSTTLRC
jgi:hypothetical protein